MPTFNIIIRVEVNDEDMANDEHPNGAHTVLSTLERNTQWLAPLWKVHAVTIERDPLFP